ncbi:SCO family protein [Thioalkalivibrio sulfidiphilus]|uniref:SCO family protein n=1 Tax=Thioalkalivibrio sulfidiphilus TaxID=1033854 RepID=UPI003B357E73
MLERGLWILVMALLVVVVWVAFFLPEAEETAQLPHRALPLAAEPVGGDFRLSREGESFDLAQHRGKVVLLYFGYTYCPDVCPTSLVFMRQALEQLEPDQLEQVQGVFVSVDPERDDPARLDEYTRFFHPNITGVSGTHEQLQQAGRLYGAAWQRTETGSAMGYAVDHSSNTYVIGRDGQLVEILPHGSDAGQILETVLALLTED